MNECPFCKNPIDKLTLWFYWDTENQIVVCEDLHKRKFKYRILIVPYGEKWHREWKDYAPQERILILNSLRNVVKAHVRNGATFIKMDTEHFSIKFHGHVQANMG